jgi:lycopene beta-cyclase
MVGRATDIAPDIAIVGGGLAGGLLALALAARRPDRRVLLIEAGNRLGGNHVWSFFLSDIPVALRWLVKPLVAARWDGYDVRFPAHSRRLNSAYRSITSERFDAHLRASLPDGSILTGVAVAGLDRHGVTLADGTRIKAGAVVDARGAQSFPGLRGGWQKFVGQMLQLEAPHGLERPIVMDASVAQEEGYRFVYALPFAADKVFVEDTYYTTSPHMERDVLAERIGAYAKAQGWRVSQVLGEEQGCLPVVAGGKPTLDDGADGVARIGSGAALFHPLTGYSLPTAVRLAGMLADLPDLSGPAMAKAAAEYARGHWRAGAYYRLLTRMLFGAAQPEHSYRIFERFYRLKEGLIERFYAGHSTGLDRMRILAGKPPVPLGTAMACLLGGGHPLARLDELEQQQTAQVGEVEKR